MNAHEARQILGVTAATSWDDVRRAYRDRIRTHHPDRAGDEGQARAVRIIEAFAVLQTVQHDPGAPTTVASATAAPPRRRPRAAFRTGYERSDHGFSEPGPTEAPPSAWNIPLSEAGLPAFLRITDDTIRFAAPSDETFRWLLEAATEVGEITYLDRSGPLMEVLCRFVGEPATSLLITVQGRAEGTDVFCSAESIEARVGPPTVAVVDVFEQALRDLAQLRP